MDTFTLTMIRAAMLATMLALWVAGVALVAYLGRHRNTSPKSPAAMPADGNGPAANAAFGPDHKEAA